MTNLQFNLSIGSVELNSMARVLEVSPFVNVAEETIINHKLKLEGQSVEELRATRNTVVKYYSDIKSGLRGQQEVDWDKFDMMENAMSKAVAVIDELLMLHEVL